MKHIWGDYLNLFILDLFSSRVLMDKCLSYIVMGNICYRGLNVRPFMLIFTSKQFQFHFHIFVLLIAHWGFWMAFDLARFTVSFLGVVRNSSWSHLFISFFFLNCKVLLLELQKQTTNLQHRLKLTQLALWLNCTLRTCESPRIFAFNETS